MPKPGIWLRKKSTGRQREIRLATILIGSAFVSFGISMLLVYLVSPVFLIFASVISGPTLLFGGVFISSIIKKDYYHNFAMLLLEPNQVEFNEMRRFIEWFLNEYKVQFDRKKKNDVEYKWYFRGKAGGFVFMIRGGDWTYGFGIRDRDGYLEDLVQSFIIEANSKFSIPLNEVWWKTFLD